MKIFRKMPNLAIIVTVAFISAVSLGPALTSCGSSGTTSSSSDDSGGGTTSTEWGSTESYVGGKSGTSDSDGHVVISSDAAGGDVQFEIVGPNGEAISGMTVEFAETSDGYIMAFVYDPNSVYQGSIISFNYNTVSSSVAGKGCVEFNTNSKVACAGICVAAAGYAAKIVIGAIFVKTVYDLGTALYELASDPPSWGSFPTHSALCISMEDLFDIYDIISLVGDTVALVFTAGSANAVEMAMDEVTSSLQDTIKDKLSDYFAAKLGIDADTFYSQRYCWVTYDISSHSSRYQDWYDISSTACSTASDCGTISTSVDPDDVDNDEDGYTPNEGDCADYDKLINPGESEICGNEVDENCDGSTSENNMTLTVWTDPLYSGSNYMVDVSGTVSGSGSSSVTYGVLHVNDRAQTVSISNGVFDDYTFVRCDSGSGYQNRIRFTISGTYCGNSSINYTCTTAESSVDDNLRVTLKWDDTADLDLHVYEPDDSHIYWSDKTPSGADGFLDVDDTNGYGPENYTAASTSAGTYYIQVTCYSGCSSGTDFEVEIQRGNDYPTVNTGTFYYSSSQTSYNPDTSACSSSSSCNQYYITIY